MKRVHSLFLLLGWAAIALAIPSAKAQLDTDTNTFSATVPGTCTISNGTQTVTMDLSNTTLSGTTSNITINANTAIKVQLSQITAVAEATADAAAVAEINDVTQSQNNILDTDASESSASSQSSLGNTAGVNHLVTVRMTATGADTPGDYNYTVVLRCLQ